ncbi:MAG: tetratricopeptide repeat protein [Casimicrobiaceae bacterium]
MRLAIALYDGFLRLFSLSGFSSVFELLSGRWPSGRSVAAWTPPAGPEEARRHLTSGRAAFRAGDARLALEEFEKAVVISPDWLEAIEAHAEALDISGETARAAAAYDRLRERRAVTRPGAPDRGYVPRHRGQFTAEVLEYGQVGRRIDRMVFPLIARGNALLAEGNPLAALRHYDRVLRMKPGMVEVRTLRGEALSAAGRFREAAASFGKVLSANRNDLSALSGHAIARMALGKVADANATWLRQFNLLPPEQAAARACVALRMADYERALPELERAIAKVPGDAYWALYRLTALHRLGLADEAPTPTDNEAWPAPLLALHAGRVDEVSVLEQADKVGRRAEAVFQLAILAAPLDKETARRWWRDVVQHGPADLIEYAAARNELARLGA